MILLLIFASICITIINIMILSYLVNKDCLYKTDRFCIKIGSFVPMFNIMVFIGLMAILAVEYSD